MKEPQGFKVSNDLLPWGEAEEVVEPEQETAQPRCEYCNDELEVPTGVVHGSITEYMPCYMCQYTDGLPRPVIVRFSEDMEQRLLENDYRGGWDKESKQSMANQLAKATGDLLKAMVDNEGMQFMTTKAADVANIAMMIANNEQLGAWPKKGYVIQDIDTGKFAKHSGEKGQDFPFIYVDRADQAESYENLDHALYVGFWHMEVGRKYRVIDYDHGGVQYVHVGGGNWALEGAEAQAVTLPMGRQSIGD